VTWNRNDPFSVGHHDVPALPCNAKPSALQSAHSAEMRNARDPHGLPPENNLSFLSGFRQLLGYLQVFADGFANVF
jgi:hypothetical protein